MNLESNVLLDFYSEQCHPCKMLTQDLDSIRSQFSNLEIQKLNIMEHYELTEKYNVRSVPTLVLLKKDKSQARYTSYKGKADLTKFLEENV